MVFFGKQTRVVFIDFHPLDYASIGQFHVGSKMLMYKNMIQKMMRRFLRLLISTLGSSFAIIPSHSCRTREHLCFCKK